MAKKQSKKNSKRRLLLLILLLVLTVTLIGGATYAWFTANTKVSIEAMQLEVTTANGIEISSDAKNWTTRLNLNDLYEAAGMSSVGSTARSEDAGSINQIPKYLRQLSTAGNVRKTGDNRLDLYTGVATHICKKTGATGATDPWYGIKTKEYTSGIEASECDTTSNPDDNIGIVDIGHYSEGTRACANAAGEDCSDTIRAVAFDIYLKTDDKSVISLAPGSYVKNNGKIDYGLKNTIRVAFVTLGTQPIDFYEFSNTKSIDADGKVKDNASDTANPTALTTLKNKDSGQAVTGNEAYANVFGAYAGVGGARRMNAFGSVSIWEPNALQHTAAGIKNSELYGRGTITGADTTDGIVTLDGNADGTDDTITYPIPYSKANSGDADYGQYFAKQQKVYPDQVKPATGSKYDHEIGYKQFADSTSENFELFTVPAGVTKVRVYIWVEGNDVDTENNATSSTIEAMMSFTTARTSADPVDFRNYEVYTNAKANVWREGASRVATAITTGTAA